MSKYVDGIIGIFLEMREGNRYTSQRWFLPCLFVSFLILYFIIKMAKNSLKKIFGGIVLCFVIGVAYVKLVGIYLPWDIEIAFIAVLFVGLGYLARKTDVINKIPSKALWILIPVAIIAVYFNYQISGTYVSFVRGIIGNPLLFLIGALGAIFTWILIFRNVERLNTLQYIGRNSLIYYGLCDLIPMFTVNVLSINILKIYPDSMGAEGLVIDIVYAIIILVIIYPLTKLINSKFSFILGKNKGH